MMKMCSWLVNGWMAAALWLMAAGAGEGRAGSYDPLAVGAGAASRRSLGTAVFGGMNAATLLAVFIVPVLYVVIQRAGERNKP